MMIIVAEIWDFAKSVEAIAPSPTATLVCLLPSFSCIVSPTTCCSSTSASPCRAVRFHSSTIIWEEESRQSSPRSSICRTRKTNSCTQLSSTEVLGTTHHPSSLYHPKTSRPENPISINLSKCSQLKQSHPIVNTECLVSQNSQKSSNAILSVLTESASPYSTPPSSPSSPSNSSIVPERSFPPSTSATSCSPVL